VPMASASELARSLQMRSHLPPRPDDTRRSRLARSTEAALDSPVLNRVVEDLLSAEQRETSTPDSVMRRKAKAQSPKKPREEG